MSNELSPFVIRPNSLSEAMELSKMIATSNFCPTPMRGKPGDVLLAMQMGSEVGLSPMQSLQNIAVINSKPCLYGDGALAVILASPSYEYHKEWEEGSIKDGTLTAYCLVKRKKSEEYVKSFSMEDAKKANLWGKAGPWSTYPNRMLQMRARAFAIRDQFADALRGINIREEVEDYEAKPVQSRPIKATITQPQLTHNVEQLNDIHQLNDLLDEYILKIVNAKTEDELKDLYINAMKEFKGKSEYHQKIIDAKDNKKKSFEKPINQAAVDEFLKEYDEDVTADEK